MPDPITVGAFVVGVLGKVAEAGLGELAKSAAKDAYETLKAKINEWANNKADILEAAPDSAKVRADIAYAIDSRAEQDQQVAALLARDVINKETSNAGRAIGLDFSDLTNATVVLKKVTATGNATGAKFQGVQGGTITVDEAAANGDPL